MSIKFVFINQFKSCFFNCIYFGNGRNDLKAMEIVKSYNGIAICPQNSRTTVKSLANFVGQYEDLRGITDGLNQYIQTLQPSQDKNTNNFIVEK